DHGSHPEFKTEWWYFTGNVNEAGGRELGYQLTFFRTGIARQATVPENSWSVRDLYLAHLAVTDADGERFHWTERVSRAGPGLAGAEEDGLEVWLRDWRAVWREEGIILTARWDGIELDLTLVPGKAPVLHGLEGLSRKGPETGQASHYVSMTDLHTVGTIKVPGREQARVTGISWFDHEFGSNQMAAYQQGWDWFGLHLSDGTQIMIYLIRRNDGSLEPASSGTLIATDGSGVHLSLDEFEVQTTGTWESPQSGARYPSGWNIRVPRTGLDVHVTPVIKEQELVTEATAGITYWEGAVRLEGRSAGKKITGGGYAELTGYAGSLGSIF
ncbi:carotenoid 1,2-hydratase, partial [bacterium]